MREQTAALGNIANPLPHLGQVTHIQRLAGKLHATRIGLDQPEYHLQQRRLTTAAGAQQYISSLGLQLKVQRVQCRYIAVAFRYVSQLEHRIQSVIADLTASR